jgi:N-acetyl-gamma-glutamyl-phosphate/LysW-gamma-L-alpha-aminoadipyl-6-phosphate reductase
VIRAAVVGASGYVGGELLRLLLGHPAVELAAAGSARLAGRRVDSVHPNLRGLTDLCFVPPEQIEPADAVFLAASSGAAMRLAPRFLDAGAFVLDLSADLRLRDPAEFERRYGIEPAASELRDAFVPGIPEAHRARLRDARAVSVPGCMANAAILALRPLCLAGAVKGPVSVDGRIGSSGSGADAEQLNLHAERSGALRVFATHGHRHEAEIAQETGVEARMGATGIEAVRGAQVVCRADLTEPLTELEVRRLYRECYRDEPFVRVVAQRRGLHRLPDPKILAGSNFCDVGFAVDEAAGAVVAIGALDNLVKGGAGNAVQCLNIRMGLPERQGLEFSGLHPA